MPLLAVGIAALIDGQRWGPPLTLSSALVCVILVLLALARAQQRRDRAIDLILDGHEHVPEATVRHQRDRLLSHRTRATLARTLSAIERDVSTTPQLVARGNAPLYHRRVVAGAVVELRRLIELLLLVEASSARGVARAERLIADPASPLYGLQTAALVEELRHVHRLFDG
jgi:hypothetical protein